MCLGALIGAGVPLKYLQDIVHQLGLEQEVKLWTELVQRGGIEATKLHVELLNHTSAEEPASPKHDHAHSHGHSHKHESSVAKHRHLPDIEKLIGDAKLPKQIEAWSLAIFRKLAIAEGAVHGIAPEAVHFHEVGAIDAIVDIVCTCAGLAWLEIDKIYCSALPIGGGYVDCDHGKMPVPAPATLKLWEMHEVTTFDNGIRKELVTPTGAAIAVTLSERFGEAPLMKLKKVGLGAGTQELEIPNAVRLWIGKSKKKD